MKERLQSERNHIESIVQQLQPEEWLTRLGLMSRLDQIVEEHATEAIFIKRQVRRDSGGH